MKKIFILLITLTLACMLCACGNSTGLNNNKDNNNNDNNNKQSNSADYSSDANDGKQNNQQGNNDTVVVPNVVGMDIDEAVRELEKLGLKVEKEVSHMAWILDKSSPKEEGVVISQDVKGGVIVAKQTKVILKYNSNTSGFEYKENNDGTITLLGCTTFWSEEHILVIPEIYEDKRVSTIIADGVITGLPDGWKVKVPQSVEIKGTSVREIIRY